MIDVCVGTLSMEFGDTVAHFNILDAMKHPSNDNYFFFVLSLLMGLLMNMFFILILCMVRNILFYLVFILICPHALIWFGPIRLG